MDYNAINEQLSFSPGASPDSNSTECFTFQPLDDALVEMYIESLQLKASSINFTGVVSDIENAIIIILDDEGECCIVLDIIIKNYLISIKNCIHMWHHRQ